MSKAPKPAKAPATDAPVVRRSRKKQIVAAILLVALAGGGSWGYTVLNTHDTVAVAPEGDIADARETKKKEEKRSPPVFLPLETFTVNLSDRDAERFAQVGITLELIDSKTSDLLKVYMPAIRNDILMLLAHKKVAELQQLQGKLVLAQEIRNAALKPLGTGAPVRGAHDADPGPEPETDVPVRAVHFSSFIIQ